jgi:hypothetical protein
MGEVVEPGNGLLVIIHLAVIATSTSGQNMMVGL